jgi:hypothetical protein
MRINCSFSQIIMWNKNGYIIYFIFSTTAASKRRHYKFYGNMERGIDTYMVMCRIEWHVYGGNKIKNFIVFVLFSIFMAQIVFKIIKSGCCFLGFS